MKYTLSKPRHLIRLTILSLLLGASAAYATEPPYGPSMGEPPCAQPGNGYWHERLVLLGTQLKPQGKQQFAWRAYVQAEQAALARLVPLAAPTELNAVDRAKLRAHWAAQQAQRLEEVSQATRALWNTLSPEQRSIFNQFAQDPMPPHAYPGPDSADQPMPPPDQN